MHKGIYSLLAGDKTTISHWILYFSVNNVWFSIFWLVQCWKSFANNINSPLPCTNSGKSKQTLCRLKVVWARLTRIISGDYLEMGKSGNSEITIDKKRHGFSSRMCQPKL